MTWKTRRLLYFLTPSIGSFALFVLMPDYFFSLWIGLAISYAAIIEIRKRKTKLLESVRREFEGSGFSLLEERLLKVSEWAVSPLQFTVLINGLPTQWWTQKWKYSDVYTRIFKAEAKDGKLWELRAIVQKKWDKTYVVEIDRMRELVGDSGK